MNLSGFPSFNLFPAVDLSFFSRNEKLAAAARIPATTIISIWLNIGISSFIIKVETATPATPPVLHKP